MYAVRSSGRTPVLVGLCALAATVLVGREAAHGHLTQEIALAATLLAAYGLGRFRRGAIIALCTLAANNALPFIDSPNALGRFTVLGDPLIEPLLVLCVWWAARRDAHSVDPRIAAFTRRWAAVFLVWYLVELIRTLVASGLPLKPAIANGHQYLYFALLALTLPRFLTRREDRIGVGVTLAAGGALFSLAVVVRDLAGVHLTALIHSGLLTQTTGGFTKDYTPAGDVAFAALTFGLAAALLGRGVRLRVAGLIVAGLCGTAIALEFTRAQYFGFILGVVTASAVWALRGGHASRRVRAVAATLLAIAALAAALFVIMPLSGASVHPAQTGSPLMLVVDRLISGINDIGSNSGTVGLRSQTARILVHVLGPDWPVGLGFLDPTHRYVIGTLNGSILDPNVGVLNIVMPMGVIGAVLLYLPLIAALGWLVGGGGGANAAAWPRFGATAWLVAVLVTSITVLVLFTMGGLLLVAVLLSAAFGAPEPTAIPPPTDS